MDVYFCVFCLISFCKTMGTMIYCRKIIIFFDEMGILMPKFFIHAVYSYMFISFISFVSMSYAYVAHSYSHVLVYIVFGVNSVIYTILVSPWLFRNWLVFIYFTPQVLELTYVLYNFKIFCGRAFYIYNKIAGNNLQIKYALKVSKF